MPRGVETITSIWMVMGTESRIVSLSAFVVRNSTTERFIQAIVVTMTRMSTRTKQISLRLPALVVVSTITVMNKS